MLHYLKLGVLPFGDDVLREELTVRYQFGDSVHHLSVRTDGVSGDYVDIG